MNILDLFWPRRCERCAGEVDRPNRHLCTDCLNRLPLIPTEGCCRRCGRDVPALNGECLCEDCVQTRPAFDRAGSAWRFEGDARQMLLDFKFNHHLWLRDDFTDALEALVRVRFKTEGIDAVTPMPPTRAHRLLRGYNPAAVLAEALAGRLGIPCRGTLRRRGSPRRQSSLDEAARRRNAAGTFAVIDAARVRGQTLLVVDDIMTTGATLSECARTLKAAGCARVYAATLARSIRV